MKQKDWTQIAIVVIISGFLSYFISNMLIAPPKNRKEQVEVVKRIKPDFVEPDKRYFNPQSVDPTQLIIIDNNNNTAPFKSN